MYLIRSHAWSCAISGSLDDCKPDCLLWWVGLHSPISAFASVTWTVLLEHLSVKTEAKHYLRILNQITLQQMFDYYI